MTGDSLPGFPSAFIGAWLLMGTGMAMRRIAKAKERDTMSKQRRWIKKRNRAMRKELKRYQDESRQAHRWTEETVRAFEQLSNYASVGLFPHRLFERMLVGVIDLVKRG